MNNKTKKPKKRISRKVKILSASAAIGAGVGFAVAGGSFNASHQRKLTKFKLTGNYTIPGGGRKTKAYIETELKGKPSGQFINIKIGGTDTKYYHVVVAEHVTSTKLTTTNMAEKKVYKVDTTKYYKFNGTVYRTTSSSKTVGSNVTNTTGDSTASLPSGTIYLKTGTYEYTRTKTQSDGYIAEKSGIYSTANATHSTTEAVIPDGQNYVAYGANTYALEEMYYVDKFTISDETGITEPSLRTSGNKNTWFKGFTPINKATVDFVSITDPGATGNSATVTYKVSSGAYSQTKKFKISFAKSKQEFANDQALTDLNAAKSTMNTQLNSKTKTGATSDATMNATAFAAFYGPLPNGVAIDSITWNALDSNKDQKIRKATIVISKTITNGTKQTVSFAKNIKFSKSENDKIVSDLEAQSSKYTNLFKDAGSTLLDGTPPTTFNAGQLKTLLIDNGVNHAGNWNVLIDTAYNSNNTSTQQTIGFHFVAGSSNGTTKTSTLNYTQTRKAKAEADALAILNSVKTQVETKMNSEVSGFVTQAFSQTNFKSFLGAALNQGVTIKTFTIADAPQNSNEKKRSVTVVIQKTAIDSGITQEATITKDLLFQKSSNEEIISLLDSAFTTNGSTLNQGTGSSPIATVPPITLDKAAIIALLKANGIDPSGKTWDIQDIDVSQLGNADKDKPQIKFKFVAGAHTSSLKTSTLTYSQSRNQSAIDAIQEAEFILTGGLNRLPVAETETGFKPLVTNGITPLITNVAWNSFDEHNFIQTANITIKVGKATKIFNNVSFTFTKRKQDTNAFAKAAQLITFTTGSNTLAATINIPSDIQLASMSAAKVKMRIATNAAHDNWFDVPAGSQFVIPEAKSLFNNGNSKELWAKFISTDTNVVLDPGDKAAKVADVVKDIKDHIDVTSINLDAITITGDTHAPVFNETAAGVHDTRVEIVYSLTDGKPGSNQEAQWMGFSDLTAATAAGFKPWMTKAEIEALFNSGHADRNIAYLDSVWKTFIIHTKLRLKNPLPAGNDKDAVLSDPNGKKTNALDSKMKALKKWINTSSTIASFDRIKLDSTKHSDEAKWVSSVATIVADAAAKGFEIQYSIKTNAVGDFGKLDPSAQIPSLDKVHNHRHLYLRFILAPQQADKKGLKDTDTLSDTSIKDVTALSDIQKVKTRVVTTSFLSTSVTLTGWLHNAVTITEGTAAPTGTKIMYSGDNGATWKSKADFTTWANANSPKRGEIKVKLVSADDIKFVVLPNETKEGLAIVTDLYSYINIDSLRDLLNIQNGKTYQGSTTKISQTGRITFGGTIGITDGAVFMVPNELTNSALDTLGLKLQFTVDKTLATWVNADIKSSQNVGGTNYSNSQKLTLTKHGTDDAFLALRIVPIKDDAGAGKSPDVNNYDDHISKTRVKPSDWVSGGPNYQVDTTKIPVQIKTEHSVLSTIKFSGQVRDLSIDETVGGKTPQQWIKDNNNGNDYWYLGKNQDDKKKAIIIKYNFEDGKHNGLWLKKDDFIKFLKDGKPIAGESLTNTAPDWNHIDTKKFKARWEMLPAKMVTPDDPAAQKLTTESNFKKWIDVSAILNRLKDMVMNGDTWHLISTDKAGIASSLDSLTGEHNFKIVYSNSNSFSTTGDTNIQTDQFDKLHINDQFDLHFKIIDATGTNKFIASTIAAPTTYKPEIKWDSSKKSGTFKTWVNVQKIDLATAGNVALSGNTKTLVTSIIKSIILKSKDGVMNAGGSTEGVEIVYKLTSTGFSNAGSVGTNNPMLLPAFKTFLTKLNHNGQWGAKDIRIGYKAKTGYAIPSGMNSVDQKPTITNLKRYIDVSTLVKQLGTIKVKPTTGFDDNTHFDSAHVEWNMNSKLSSIDTNFNTKLQFLLKTTPGKPSVLDTNWKGTLPTKLDDDKTKRYLFVKIVNKGKVDNEDLILSDGSFDALGRKRTIEIHDITSTSTIKTTLTNIPLGSLDLTKLTLTGTTKDIVTDESGIGRTGFLASHAKLYYYIDGTPLTGDGNIPATKYLEADFKKFMAANPTTSRTKIRTILIPDAGYTFKPSDINMFKDDAKRKPIITDLYSWYDTSTLTPLLTLNVQGITGIGLTGRAASEVVYNLPPKLVESALAAKHLKLQWSVSEVHGPTTWKDAHTSNLGVDTVPGAKASPHGEKITLTATASSASGHLAFRLVPLQDDLGVTHAPTGKQNYNQYVEVNKAKPSDYKPGGKAYDIDTSQIPILIQTKSADLSTITIIGNTHNVVASNLDVKINGSLTIAESIKAANSKATPAQLLEIGKQISLEYSIDDQGTRQWLLKDAFLKFLKTGTYTDKAGTAHTLDYAKIKFNSVEARWAAITLSPKPKKTYVPSDTKATKIMSAQLKKWINVQEILDKLKGIATTDKLELSGDTNKLVDTNGKFRTILTKLNGLPNPNISSEFEIQVTNKFTNSTTPNFGSATKDALPRKLNDKYELAFKLVAKNINSNKFFLATNKDFDVENPSVIWATTTAHSTIKKWINVKKDVLKGVILKGDTQSIQMTVNPDFISSKDREVVATSTSGKLVGLEVWYRLTGTTEGKPKYNNNALPENVFKEYLDGKLTENGGKVYISGGQDVAHEVTKYGFTTGNYKIIHDGSWGAKDIRVGYHAKDGFKIDHEVFDTDTKTNNPSEADITPTTTNLHRFIDIAPIIQQEKNISLDAAFHIDSKNIHFKLGDLLKDSPGPKKLMGKIYWSTKPSPSINDASAWSRTAPTEVSDRNRKIWVKFVAGTSNGEVVNLSDGVSGTGNNRVYTSKRYDITSQLHLNDFSQVPINIATSGITLQKILVSGETNNLAIVDADSKTGRKGNSKNGAFIGYSLSNFGPITQPIVDRIDGVKTVQEAQTAGLKESMTKKEFILFVNGDTTHAKHNIKRNDIKVRLEAKTDYAIVPSDKTKTKEDVIHTELYSYIDVNKLASELSLKDEDSGRVDAKGKHILGKVKLQGSIGPNDGILMSLPDEFSSDELLKRNLKLQFTITPTIGGGQFNDKDTTNGYKAMKIDPNAAWKDTKFGIVKGTTSNGFTTVSNGQLITLTKGTYNYALLAFRLVPIKNDDNDNSSLQPDNEQEYNLHIKGTMSKPSDLVENPTLSSTPTRNGLVHYINTAKIPTTIFTDSSVLKKIKFTGDTHKLKIIETDNGLTTGTNIIDTIKNISKNKDGKGNFNKQYLKEVEVVYTIDKFNGNPIWLDKEEMEAYLNGGLELKNQKVVFKTTGKEVFQLSKANRAIPNYLELNISEIKAKWQATKGFGIPVIGAGYTPSQGTEEKPNIPEGTTSNDSFRKWFDDKPFKDALKDSIVSGNTKKWTVNFKGAASLDSTFLKRHKLKIQYWSGEVGKDWTDKPFDFLKLAWTTQKERIVYARVVPLEKGGEKRIIIGDNNGDGLSNTNTELKTKEFDHNSGERVMKVYLDVNKNELSKVVALGSNHELWGYDIKDPSNTKGDVKFGLLENNMGVTVDNNARKYSELEIMYLYDGHYYNKADLFKEIEKKLKKGSYSNPPSDFKPRNIKAKWRVIHQGNYVIAANQDKPNLIDSSKLAEWINISSIQMRPDNSAQQTDGKPYTGFVGGINTKNVQGSGNSLSSTFKLTGDLKELNLTWKKSGLIKNPPIDNSVLDANHMKVQYSLTELPENTLQSKDWLEGWPGKTNPAKVNSKTRALWIRFVPKDESKFVLSNSFRSITRKLREYVPIKIDTTKVKYSIKVDSSVLSKLKFEGTTQKFLRPTNAKAIESSAYNNKDPKIKKEDATNEYAFIAYQVIATRTEGIYTAGKTYAFTVEDKGAEDVSNGVYSVKRFYDDIKNGNLNFYAKDLKVAWRIQDTKSINNAASDERFVSPDVTKLQNFVYTKDLTTLTNKSYDIKGNNLKLQWSLLDMKLSPGSLKNLGLKIQYNVTSLNGTKAGIDNNKWFDWDNVDQNQKLLKKMPAHRNIFIRFVPIKETLPNSSKAKYITNGTAAEVANGAVDGSQVTKLDASKSKIAIALSSAFMHSFNGITTTGTTELKDSNHPGGFVLHPGGDVSKDLINGQGLQIPKIFNKDEARYQYSIGVFDTAGVRTGEDWQDNIADALKDSYGKGKALDKDRDLEGLKIRMLVKDDINFVITDLKGNEKKPDQMKHKIDINPLVQPIYTDVPVDGINAATGRSTWQDFANAGPFKPEFRMEGTPKWAKFTKITYDGKDIDSTGKESIYKLNENKYYTGHAINRSSQTWNALAPRHTHFEFQYKAPGANSWGTPTLVVPKRKFATSTNYKGFKVTLMPGDINDQGQLIDDKSIPTSASKLTYKLETAQKWSKEYSVVLIKNTEKWNIKSIEFLGFNESTGVGRIAQDNKVNPNEGMPKISFKDDKGNEVSTDSIFGDFAFTLEYKVTTASGSTLVWKDSNGLSKSGWHEFAKAPIQGDSTYPKRYKKYGYPPVSLKNGEKVYIRLRANDGWVIIDSKSTDKNLNGYSKFSHPMNPIVVDNLKTELTLPTDTMVFTSNPEYNLDKDGKRVTDNPKMPHISFIGNDGYGAVKIKTGSMPYSAHITPEVQWLRPWKPGSFTGDKKLINDHLQVIYGYELVTSKKDAKGKYITKIVFKTKEGKQIDGGNVGWVPDIDMIKNSWWKPEDIKELAVGDSINIRFIAKDGYAFKWEDDRNNYGTTTKFKAYTDVWVPKVHTKQIFNQNKKDDMLSSIRVNGLLVKPPYKPSDVKMGYSPIDSKHKLPYNGRALLNPNPNSKKTDKWQWVYSETENGKYKSSLPTLNIKNGFVFWMKASSKFGGIHLDPSYKNVPTKFTVSGLTDMISTETIARPKLSFEGYVGHAKISKITPNINTMQPNRKKTYLSAGNKQTLEQPNTGWTSKDKLHHGVTWEFQVANQNPDGMSPLDIDKLIWKKEEPNTLRIGQYIRMRVAPIDKVDSVEPPLYSISDDGKGKPLQNPDQGWVKVINLKLNANNIEFEPIVKGFQGKTTVIAKFSKKSYDELGIEMMAKITYRAKGGKLWGKWVELKDKKLSTLESGDKVSYKAIAKTKEGYIVDVSQPAGYPASSNGGEHKNAYIQKATWKNVSVKGMKEYLDVDGVTLKDVVIVRDAKHPKKGQKGYEKPATPVDQKHPDKKVELNDSDILSGYATINPDGWSGGNLDNANDKWGTGWNNIVDIHGKPIGTAGVKIQFTVMKYDPDSSSYSEIPASDLIPKGLQNRDKVKVELVPTDPLTYKLSSEKVIWLTINGLIKPSPKMNQPPTLTFLGQNNFGTVVITPIAQSGFKWVYNVQKIGQPETSKFVDEVPMNLENGDRVRVELSSAIQGEKITDNFRTKFITVSNLIFKFDMSNIKIDNRNKILSIIGKQEKETKVFASEPYSLSSVGKKIKHTDKMKWKFVVIHKGDKTIPKTINEFKNTLPEKLVNGDKVYATLVSTDPDLEVIGFKPLMKEIKDLKPESKVTGKMSIMILAIAGGVLTAGVATAILFVFKNKKKRML